MASEDESSKSFKIQDRRRFSAEGDLKPEFSGADEPSTATAKPEAPRPSESPPQSAGARVAKRRNRKRRVLPNRSRRPRPGVMLLRAPRPAPKLNHRKPVRRSGK
jgi:hypothetical protein